MTTTPGRRTRTRRLPTARTLTLGAIRTIADHASAAARRPSGCVLVTVYFRAAADPAVPAILAGTYYTDPDAGRELTDSVEQLLSGRIGDAGFGAQAVAVAVPEQSPRHAFPATSRSSANYSLSGDPSPVAGSAPA